MSKKPLFADGWYETPRTGELRQEIQHLYETKADSPHTHTEADITDLTKGPIRVFRTSNTSSLFATQWTRVARVEIVNRFDDFNTTWLVQESEASAGTARQGLVRFRVKQQNDFGNDPALTLSMESFEPLTSTYGYVIVQTTPTTIVEVYVRADVTFTRINGFDLGTQKSPRTTVTYFDSEPWNVSVSGLELGQWSRFARFDIMDTLTGDFVGSLTGTASGNLPLTGGSLTGKLTVTADVTDQLVVRRSASSNRIEVLAAAGTTNESFIRNTLSNGTVDGSIIIDGVNDRLIFRPGDTGGTRREVWHAGNLPYESGTWTPTIGVGTLGTGTVGHYTRIGNLVYLYGTIGSMSDSTSAVDIEVGGLPFTPTNQVEGPNNPAPVGPVSVRRVAPVSSDFDLPAVVSITAAGTLKFVENRIANFAGSSPRFTRHSQLVDAFGRISFSITYQTT